MRDKRLCLLSTEGRCARKAGADKASACCRRPWMLCVSCRPATGSSIAPIMTRGRGRRRTKLRQELAPTRLACQSHPTAAKLARLRPAQVARRVRRRRRMMMARQPTATRRQRPPLAHRQMRAPRYRARARRRRRTSRWTIKSRRAREQERWRLRVLRCCGSGVLRCCNCPWPWPTGGSSLEASR